jgi:hypothetical protein
LAVNCTLAGSVKSEDSLRLYRKIEQLLRRDLGTELHWEADM